MTVNVRRKGEKKHRRKRVSKAGVPKEMEQVWFGTQKQGLAQELEGLGDDGEGEVIG